MQAWHVNDLDAQLTDETPLIAGLHWGYNAPGCVVWARILPNWRVYLQADVKFIRLPIEDVCVDLIRRASALGLPRSRGTYASPDLFSSENEPEYGVEIEPIADGFARHGFPLIPAHGDVTHGFSRMHDYARAAPDGLPWLVVSPRCKATITTLPTLTQKKTNREELDGEYQYAAHAIRCLLSSRPAPRANMAPVQHESGTRGWLRQQMDKIDADQSSTTGFRMRRLHG